MNDVHLFEAAIDLLSFASLKEMQNYEWNAVDDNGIVDTEGFRKFLRACAAFSGQLLNYNDLGTTAGVSGVTAKEWVKVLQSMGIIFLLEPYYSNELKRMIKTPKLYFCDTGLCAFLSSWTSRDVLMNGAAAGHFLENYVVAEMIRNVSYGEKEMILNFIGTRIRKKLILWSKPMAYCIPLRSRDPLHRKEKQQRSFLFLRQQTAVLETAESSAWQRSLSQLIQKTV